MDKQLKETLVAITRAQSPDMFRRDTPLLLETLDNIERINKNLRDLSECSLAKKQAE